MQLWKFIFGGLNQAWLGKNILDAVGIMKDLSGLRVIDKKKFEIRTVVKNWFFVCFGIAYNIAIKRSSEPSWKFSLEANRQPNELQSWKIFEWRGIWANKCNAVSRLSAVKSAEHFEKMRECNVPEQRSCEGVKSRRDNFIYFW